MFTFQTFGLALSDYRNMEKYLGGIKNRYHVAEQQRNKALVALYTQIKEGISFSVEPVNVNGHIYMVKRAKFPSYFGNIISEKVEKDDNDKDVEIGAFKCIKLRITTGFPSIMCVEDFCEKDCIGVVDKQCHLKVCISDDIRFEFEDNG